MNIRIRESAAVFILIYLIVLPVKSFSQEPETVADTSEISLMFNVQERSFPADLGHAVFGVTLGNVFINYLNRLADEPYGHTTFMTIWRDIRNPGWMWEEGDRFFVNNYMHPYHGSMYFAAARVSGFNFYESLIFAPLGAVMWEIAMEPGPASINDVITTSLGGISVGEMLHRLYLEALFSKSVAKRAAGALISPMSGLATLYNRPSRETGGGNIYRTVLRTGVNKTFAFLPGYEYYEASWDYPGGYLGLSVVYGDPFTQQSSTPYDHFEFSLDVAYNIKTIQITFVSDGYLFSYNPIYTERSILSTGLSMHCDIYYTAEDILDNHGHGNVMLGSNAIGWTLKNKRLLSEKSHLEFQAHAAVIVWGNSLYNSGNPTKSPWGNFSMEDLRGAYGAGEAVKLGFAFSNDKAGRLDLNANAYHLIAIPVNEKHSFGNLLFIYGALDYSFPLGKTIGIGLKSTYWKMLGFYNEANNVDRSIFSNCLYVRFLF